MKTASGSGLGFGTPHRPPSRVCPVVEAYPQQPRNFSLHVDDQVCLPELILEPCVSPLQLAYLLIQRISEPVNDNGTL